MIYFTGLRLTLFHSLSFPFSSDLLGNFNLGENHQLDPEGVQTSRLRPPEKSLKEAVRQHDGKPEQPKQIYGVRIIYCLLLYQGQQGAGLFSALPDTGPRVTK